MGLAFPSSESRSTLVYMYPAFFFGRRALLVALAVYLRDWFVLQYVFYFVTSYVAIYIAIERKPYASAAANWLEVSNEVTGTVLLYHVMGFGGYVE